MEPSENLNAAHGMVANLQRLFELGGPVVAILAALSVVALAMILLKTWQFMRFGVGVAPDLSPALSAWEKGDKSAGRRAADALRGPTASLLASTMRALALGAPEEVVREDAQRLAARELASFRVYLRPLDVISQTAPLLGLFGTVLGMIEAFRQLQSAGNQVDPSTLAGGIWVALLTTAVGLAVAMPVSMAVSWFEARIAREHAAMENAVTALLTARVIERRDDAPVRVQAASSESVRAT